MTDTELLRQLIEESGMSKTTIAKRAGITRDRLYRLMDGVDAKACEIEGLARVLRMTNPTRDKVFFGKKVVEEATL